MWDLRDMASNQKQARMFGTNGIRGVPNHDLNQDLCINVGLSISKVFHEYDTIAMARDTRKSGPYIFSLVSSGILSGGRNIVDIGVLPTPALQLYCKDNGIPGVMITASHNPPQYNGIKVIDPDGTEASQDTEMKIERVYHEGTYLKSEWSGIGYVWREPDYYRMYIDRVMKSAGIERGSIKYNVVFDAGNGASYLTTPLLLQNVGTRLVTLNCNPDGRFSSRNSEPKPENLKDLSTLISGGSYDIAIAHDGDADRCIFFDEKGTYIDGNVVLAIFARYLCKRGDTVVTPVSTSDAVQDVCDEKGIKLIRTKVGAPIVARKLRAVNGNLGGEENGGIIYPRHQYCRDGAMTAALMISIMHSSGKSLSELVSEVPAYTTFKDSVKRTQEWNTISSLIIEAPGIVKVDETDGLKIFERDGWALIRPSGTEPIIRIYTSSRSRDAAERLLNKYKDIIARAES